MVADPPALISRHPRVPAVELMHGPRLGHSYLVAIGVDLTSEQLVDVGEWLIEHGKQPERQR